MRPARTADAILAVVYAVLSGGFAWVFYVRYWKWRECIEMAMSSCITPEGDSLIGGGRFWLIPAVAFAIAAARRLLRRFFRSSTVS